MHPKPERYRINPFLNSLLLLLLLLSFGCARKNFYASTPVADPTVYRQLQQEPATVDSVTVQAGRHYKRSFLYKALWGERHRKAWSMPVTVPVLQVDTVKGGFKIEKIGGGKQSINVTMVGGDGMTYSLRTVDKRPEINLPFPLSKTFIADLVLDQTSALHPYAALVVAPLASAAGVVQATPVLVYVRPKEEKLGEHNELLSDRLYMLEEKYNDKRALIGELDEAQNIVGTGKMLKQRYSDSNHTIDELAFAKARLLDLLIGDRDRHEDQWEWAVYKEGPKHIYRTIPKDRDNAFYRIDNGLLTWLMSRKWAFRKYASFSGKYKDVKALTIKSKDIDARAMPQVTAQQFDSLARELQRSLTDEVIEQAVRRLPEAVYRLEGESLAVKLKNRRDKLDKAAREFYQVLAKEVLVIGTDEAEQFEVVRLNDEETEVTVRRKSDGTVTYHRVFHRAETKRVELHGLGGSDEFNVEGQVRKGIKITIVDEEREDNIRDISRVGGWRKKLAVYNSKQKPDM
ncbi:hypothetical protein [Pontibacter pamirensis]|uniref:hypothetical protein n=1 Tax=Pontibacter pamirensis TaxID=2562824 RepID=UPI00138A5E5F|nr:hypothetical protein [Pontibacter pamirensis]